MHNDYSRLGDGEPAAAGAPWSSFAALAGWIDRHRLLSLLIGVATIFGFALFNHGLIPSMEPRFAEAIREMAARGEYLVPVKNGVPYIEYPPLYFWLGLAGHLAGLPIAAAIRLPGYLALLLWVVWLARLQRRLFPEWPAVLLPLAGVALPGILYNFFTAQSDSVLILGTLIAFTGYVRERPGFNWELWGGVALATLAKGPVGLAITLPAMGLDMVFASAVAGNGVSGVWQRLRACAPLRGLGFVLLLNVPWYLAAGFAVGWEFVRAVLVYQNFTRFLVGFDHPQPWWYYGQTIFYDLFPLAFLFPLGLWCARRRLAQRAWRLPLCWALWTLLFFSLSQSKQGKYILPAAPAIAALALAAIECLPRAVVARHVYAWLGRWAVFLLAGFGALVVLWLPAHSERLLDLGGYRRISAAIAARPGTMATYLWPRAAMLYRFDAPLPYARSARALYRMVHSGRLRAGDYLLVNREYIANGRATDGPQALRPRPAPPYFERVLRVDTEGGLVLYRVLPGAAALPVPKTPVPPPHHWWEQFDTD